MDRSAEDGIELKLYTVTMQDMGEYKITAASFHVTAPEDHLMFLDEDGEVTARFRTWTAVMEIRRPGTER